MYQNKSKPYILFTKNPTPIEWFSEYDKVYTWRVNILAAKHKDGVYRPKDRYIASQIFLNDVEERIIEDTHKIMKKGRYHDWFFAPAQRMRGVI